MVLPAAGHHIHMVLRASLACVCSGRDTQRAHAAWLALVSWCGMDNGRALNKHVPCNKVYKLSINVKSGHGLKPATGYTTPS